MHYTNPPFTYLHNVLTVNNSCLLHWYITCSTIQWPLRAATSSAVSATTSWPCPSEMLWKFSCSTEKPSLWPSFSTSFSGSTPGDRMKNIAVSRPDSSYDTEKSMLRLSTYLVPSFSSTKHLRDGHYAITTLNTNNKRNDLLISSSLKHKKYNVHANTQNMDIKRRQVVYTRKNLAPFLNQKNQEGKSMLKPILLISLLMKTAKESGQHVQAMNSKHWRFLNYQFL